MEHNSNNSRIGIELGAPIDGNEKSSIKFAFNFGKAAADLQTEKLKGIIGAEDPNFSVVIVLTPVPDKEKELEAILKDIMRGKAKGKLARDASELLESGLVSYKVIHSGSNVVLLLKPGSANEAMLYEYLRVALEFGVQDLVNTEQAAINFNLVSAIDAYDLLDYHSKKYSTLAALWTSSMIELTIKTLEGSKLDTKLLNILKKLVPVISESPFPLLQFVKTVDVDFSFRDVDELPSSLKQFFGSEDDDTTLIQFPRVPDHLKDSDEVVLFKRLTEVLEADIDVYVTVEKIAAAQLNVKIPGFGVMLTTPVDI